ncbi:50S ribosomal protein L32, chloroplastic [Capsicum baccatum]|uniref:50S ribosomal protein L32, chloroplastic n=1 Tax=Capsicum baccatum TaxID=33114 RepID=A0A2G2W619_CAPBA|nr:50S ribosomal protein L32, chloroplastic [Capsicum baccatum]
MAVPKEHTSRSKKCICKSIWKRKTYWITLKAFSLAKAISTGESKRFFWYTKQK